MPIKQLDHVNFLTHDISATLDFYCSLIGLECRTPATPGSLKTIYLYLPGTNQAVLHVGNAKRPQKQPDYLAMASISETHSGSFSTGSFDHFALAFDDSDYSIFIEKLTQQDKPYQTYCHIDKPLKQIWLLDPNGVRVELSFS